MSLINYILGQKVILLTVGVALLIFLAAVTLNFAVALRASLRSRARRKQAEQARKEAERARKLAIKRARAAARAQPESEPEPRFPFPLPVVNTEMAVEEQSVEALVLEAEAAMPQTAEGAGTIAAPVTSMTAAPTVPPPSEPTVAKIDGAPAMQSLLSDVFGDDEDAERYASLLDDTALVQLDDLLAQVNRVAQELNAINTRAAHAPERE